MTVHVTLLCCVFFIVLDLVTSKHFAAKYWTMNKGCCFIILTYNTDCFMFPLYKLKKSHYIMKMNFDCIWMGHNCLLCITFKTIGGKQLIYDSVCAGQDYKLQMFSGKEFHLGVTSKTSSQSS